MLKPKYLGLLVLVVALSTDAFPQFGNTINGFVFGPQRTPVSDAPVELLDDFSRSIARTRTNGSGRYTFTRLPSGRFRVRTFSVTAYEDQEQSVEIQNIRRDVGGSIVTTAVDNIQLDFYLRPRKSAQGMSASDVVFAQNVPEAARGLYRKGIDQLDNKQEAEGLKSIKASIENFPDYFEAIEKLGTEYVRLGHFEAAEILLNRATEINPKSFRSWYGLAYARNSLNRIDGAAPAVAKALFINQTSVEAHLLDGVIQRRRGDYAAAEKQLLRAAELAPNSAPEVHWHLALLYGNNMKRYREAAEQLELYLKKKPDVKDRDGVKKLIEQYRQKSQEVKN